MCVLAYIIVAEPVVIQMEPPVPIYCHYKGKISALPARTEAPLIWPVCSSATHLTRNKRKGSAERKGRSALPSSSPVCRGTHPALFAGRLLLGNRCGTVKHKSGLFGKGWMEVASVNQLAAIDYEVCKKKGLLCSWRCFARIRLEGLRSAMEN